MNVIKHYLMYVSYTRKVYVYYLCWNNMIRVGEHHYFNVNTKSFDLISFWTFAYISTFRSKYVWYGENYHYISIVIILFWINMNNYMYVKTHNLINFRCKVLIFHKYSLTCPQMCLCVTRDLELNLLYMYLYDMTYE